MFCTMSPAATVLSTSVSYTEEDGVERYGYAMIPADAEASTCTATGTPSDARLRQPLRHFEAWRSLAAALRGGFPTGDADGYMTRNLNAGLFHASVSLGIAEAAQEQALPAPRRCRRTHARRCSPPRTHRPLGRAPGALSHAPTRPIDERPRPRVAALFAETQPAKTFVNERSAARSSTAPWRVRWRRRVPQHSPLARAYRDVRAGASCTRSARTAPMTRGPRRPRRRTRRSTEITSSPRTTHEQAHRPGRAITATGLLAVPSFASAATSCNYDLANRQVNVQLANPSFGGTTTITRSLAGGFIEVQDNTVFPARASCRASRMSTTPR